MSVEQFMQPFTVMLGIVLGSLFSIAFSLTIATLIFWFLQDEDPRYIAEMPELIRGTLIFSTLAFVAATGFIGTIRGRPWRYLALMLLWAGLLTTAYYYWPE